MDSSSVDIGAEAVAAEAPTSSAHGSSAPSWTPSQLRIRDWLEDKAPHLAPLYEGAVRMVMDEAFPGRVTFVWHAIREIRNRLPDAVAGAIGGARVESRDLADEVWRCWQADGLPVDGSLLLADESEPSPAGPKGYEVSQDLFLSVAGLVSGHANAGTRNREKAQRLFETVFEDGVPAYVVAAWVGMGKRAHGLAHARNSPHPAEDEERLSSEFAAFESALLAMANRSYENMDDLDEILDSANR